MVPVADGNTGPGSDAIVAIPADEAGMDPENAGAGFQAGGGGAAGWQVRSDLGIDGPGSYRLWRYGYLIGGYRGLTMDTVREVARALFKALAIMAGQDLSTMVARGDPAAEEAQVFKLEAVHTEVEEAGMEVAAEPVFRPRHIITSLVHLIWSGR